MHVLRFRIPLVVVLLLLGLSAASDAAAEQQLTEERVDEAINKLIEQLYESQHEDGGWYGAYHSGPDEPQSKNNWGPSSMALLALLTAGESPEKPAILNGLKRVTQEEITGLYPLSMRTQMLAKVRDDQAMMRFLKTDTLTLHNSKHRLSRFDYAVGMNIRPSMRIDNSTTQYGVIGVWSADQRGLKAPKDFWEDVVMNFLELQGADGGWAYSGARNTTQSMTLAGLTCLYLAQQHTARKDAKADAQIEAAIEKGLNYLDHNLSVNARVHGGVSYQWMGYTRVGQLSGRWEFGGQDVYREIATQIANEEKQLGNSIHTMAFNLMVLIESHRPIWINKLKIDGTNWNNRPNDIYFLNQYIGQYNEAKLNWRVVDIESNSRDWSNAPILWLSSDGAIEWTERQAANIKRYLELGGTLIANPERQGGHAQFVASIKALGKKMYPGLAFEEMGEDHPLATRAERGRAPRGVQVLNGGGRALIVVPRLDWGRALQSDERPSILRHEAWFCMTNLFDQVNEAGLIKKRLQKPE
ncbi:MAG: DUF4159 domain-containing protein [Planctomycetota bacterium]